ncbi:MAG: Rv3235 family protein [Nocardioidaceae bacterium]
MNTSPNTSTAARRLAVPRARLWDPTSPGSTPSASLGGHESAGYTQGALALTFPLAAVPGRPPGLDAEPLAVTALATAADAPRRVPNAYAWATRFVQAVLEVVSSDRPLTQLARWTSQPVYDDIARRQRRVSRHRSVTPVRTRRQQVATIRVCHPSDDSAEVSARVVSGPRSHAIAVRLDLDHERWMCTSISFG